MASSTPVKEMVFFALATAGLSWKASRDSTFSTEIGKRLFAYGEEMSPAHGKSQGISSLARRAVSNMAVNVAHLTEVASLATEALRNQVLGVSKVNPEAEKVLAEMQQALNQQHHFNASCQKAVADFQCVVEEFQEVNKERVDVHKMIISQEFPSLPDLSLEALSGLVELTNDLKTLAQEQPAAFQKFVELATQIDQENQYHEEEQKKIQKLEKELLAVTHLGTDSKEDLTERLQNSLTPLVKAATPNRPPVVLNQMKTGTPLVGFAKRALLFVDPT